MNRNLMMRLPMVAVALVALLALRAIHYNRWNEFFPHSDLGSTPMSMSIALLMFAMLSQIGAMRENRHQHAPVAELTTHMLTHLVMLTLVVASSVVGRYEAQALLAASVTMSLASFMFWTIDHRTA